MKDNFRWGPTRVIVAEGTEGSSFLGPERLLKFIRICHRRRRNRYNADIRATNIILQGLPKDIYSLINHYTDAKDIWDNVKMLLEGSELARKGPLSETQLYDWILDTFRSTEQEAPAVIERAQYMGGLDTALLCSVWWLRVATESMDVGDLVDQKGVFKCYDCDAYDVLIVDEAPTAQTMLSMANLSSADPVYDDAEARDIDVCTEPNHIVDSHADYTSDSNMTPYDQNVITFGAIKGYGDYVIGDSVISRVYYVEGLGHKLFSVSQFCDSDLEVAFKKHSCYVCDTDGVEYLMGPACSNCIPPSLLIDMMKSLLNLVAIQSLYEQIWVMASAIFKPLELLVPSQ
ncbi:hypothetical protein Tco_0660466 [Tanacetum coccineum]